MTTDSISDFDPDDKNLKENRKGMDGCWKILYHRTASFNCFQILLACLNKGGIYKTQRTHKRFIEKSETGILGKSRCIYEDNIKMDHYDKGVRKWTAFKWLTIKTSGDILWKLKWTWCFHKRDYLWGTQSISRKGLLIEFIRHHKSGL